MCVHHRRTAHVSACGCPCYEHGVARSTPLCRGIGIPFVSVLRVVATYPVSEGTLNVPALLVAQVAVRCYVPPCGRYVRPRTVPQHRPCACPELCARCGVVPCPHLTQGHLTLALHTHDLCGRCVLQTGSLFVAVEVRHGDLVGAVVAEHACLSPDDVCPLR
jgi:hypothetical protein